jgi:hypothetical protein
MFKILLTITIALSFIHANISEELLKDIKLLIEQNGQKIEQNAQLIKQNGQKIEQNSSDIKTIQSQISFIQVLLSIVLGGVIAAPFFVIYLQRKDDKYLEKETRKNSNIIQGLLTTLRVLSENDPKIQSSLKIAGLT